jgi:hypothetical protein
MTSLDYTTEDEIERWAERQMDRLDRMFKNGAIDEEDYTARVADIESECKIAYREMRKRDDRAWEGRSIFQHSWDGA